MFPYLFVFEYSLISIYSHDSGSSQKLSSRRLYETFAGEEGGRDEEHAGPSDSFPAANEYFTAISVCAPALRIGIS